MRPKTSGSNFPKSVCFKILMEKYSCNRLKKKMERQKDSWYQTINNQPIPNDFNCLIKSH